MNINAILQKDFGFAAFKEGQKAIIETIISGRDVLAVMPTGAGKSLCFQVPALALAGTTVVISPLISLMKDQVDSLSIMGVEAAFINSSLPPEEMRRITAKARSGAFKLIYVAPERLELDNFRALLAKLDIALVAVDEAHCISQWGHDFRPSYRNISSMIATLPKRPTIAAFTATATPQVKNDITTMLDLRHPFSLVTGFDRANLYFEVEKPAAKFAYLTGFLQQHGDASGIIYCATRKTVDSISEKLNALGFPCTRYHAGLTEEERAENQDAFINDHVPIIAATVAFGMGIDKSNIRYVLHYNMPKTMEHYYQEAGRAGRDGEAAQCILLYSPADIITNKFLIEQGDDQNARTGNYKKLQEIIDYCHTGICLRRYILNYFGEVQAPEKCGNCGNCLNTIEQKVITLEAQKILSCIKRMGERFGSGLTADVLRGAQTVRIRELGFEKLSTYGLMSEYSKPAITELIAYLAAMGMVDVCGDQYPVLSLNKAAYAWLKSNKELTIRHLVKLDEAKKGSTSLGRKRKAGLTPLDDLSSDRQILFEKLRQLRREIAASQKVPPYVVFSDATLLDMCKTVPTEDNSMLSVSGVGNVKLEKYGLQFLTVIREHLQSS
jgi:ATP-dependent DNA helicase RecQ